MKREATFVWPDLSLRRQTGSTEQGEAVRVLLRPFRALSVGGSAEQTRFIQQQVLPGHFVRLKRDLLLPNIWSLVPIGRTPFVKHQISHQQRDFRSWCCLLWG